jgi:hypothetical protein
MPVVLFMVRSWCAPWWLNHLRTIFHQLTKTRHFPAVTLVHQHIDNALKMVLVTLLVITCISTMLLWLQASTYMAPAFRDTDGDGFRDIDEQSWLTSATDPVDNPVTSRIMPVAIALTCIAVILGREKLFRSKRRLDVLPGLARKFQALQDALKKGDRASIKALLSSLDGFIGKLRSGPDREAFKEPRVQEILVAIELAHLDVAIDEDATMMPNKEPTTIETGNDREKEKA